MTRESATDRLIVRAIEERLARLDALIDGMEVLNVAQQEAFEALAQRCFFLEHRIDLLEQPERRGRYDA